MHSDAFTNRLLRSLDHDDCRRVLAASQRVELPIRTQLISADEPPRALYFLNAGLASTVFTSVRGTTVELATFGSEGLIGSSFLLGAPRATFECRVQVAAEACRLPLAAAQQLFDSAPSFRTRVLEFMQHQFVQANQLVACNRLHRAEARFARWLLMVEDRLGSGTLEMTQEFLSDMLGTRRTTVAEVSAVLGRAGAIETRRGTVRILDRARLEGYACECYGLLKRSLDQLYT